MMSYLRDIKDIIGCPVDESVWGNVVLDHEARIHSGEVEYCNVVVESYAGFENNGALVRDDVEFFSGGY